MKKIQILGPGCPNCERLAALTDRVARELGIEYEIENIDTAAHAVGLRPHGRRSGGT